MRAQIQKFSIIHGLLSAIIWSTLVLDEWELDEYKNLNFLIV